MQEQVPVNFDEYTLQGEPTQRERAEAWRVAIGLQAMDGGGLKGQPAASPAQHAGAAASPAQRHWQNNTTRITTAPKGHKQ